MALPEILPPAGTPPFLREQAQTRRSVHRPVPMGVGHAHSERTQRTAARVVQVAWQLTPPQAEAVEAWFENVLAAGTREFAARVAADDGARWHWWRARWLAPPQWEPTPIVGAGPFRHAWRVTGALLLSGSPSLVPPVVTGAAVEFRAHLRGKAAPFGPANGAVEFTAALLSLVPAGVEFRAALVSLAAGQELREDDGLELREDGGIEYREPEAIE